MRQWRFSPARINHLETVTAQRFTYQRVRRSETVEAEVDLVFTFTPAGKVQAGDAK